MDIYERILLYAEVLYQRALERFEAGLYRRAEYAASAASGAAVFVEQDAAVPEELRIRARALNATLEDFLGTTWKARLEDYGDRYLSGPSRHKAGHSEKDVTVFMSDLRSAAREAHNA